MRGAGSSAQIDLVTEAHVARQLARLRHHGWSTLDALALIVPALPVDRPLRARLEASLRRLQASTTPPAEPFAAEPRSALSALVAGGEAATPEALEAVAEAAEAELKALQALGVVRWLAASVPVALLSLGTLPQVLGPLASGPRAGRPSTQAGLLLELPFPAWGAFVLALVSLPFALRLPARGAPGVRELRAAATLQACVAGVASGPAGPRGEPTAVAAAARLSRNERRLFERCCAEEGLVAACRVLATELLRAGTLKKELVAALGPLAGLLVVCGVVTPMLQAAYEFLRLTVGALE